MSGSHAWLSPSGAHRWMRCTGSPAAEDAYPDDASPFAAEGSAAHLLAEERLRDGKAAPGRVGEKLEMDGHTIMVDKEMAWHVERYAEYCESIGAPASVVEAKVDYSKWVEGGTGTADYVAICPDTKRVHVVDLKYGKGVQVEAEGNEQLMLYALGVVDNYDFMLDAVDTVRMEIFQPRLDHHSVAEVRIDDLLAWADNEVAPVAEDILAGRTKRVPGDWCRFCKARKECPARIGLLSERPFDAPSGFENLDEDPDDESPVSTATLAALLPRLALVEQLCKDLRDSATERAVQGEAIPGYKLVESRTNRAWKDTDRAETAMRNSKDISIKDIFVKKLVGPAGAEKILGKGHPLLKKHVHKPEGKPVLAEESDRRPAISTVNDFDKLEAHHG